MSFELTTSARKTLENRNVLPNLVLEIDGVEQKYGVLEILKYIRVGDPGLIVDGSWYVGGKRPVENQSSILTFDGTSSQIQQQLAPDTGSASSVSALQVALADINDEATRLITPGEVVEDILGRRATVWYGFGNLAFPDDYIRIHRGVINDILAGDGKVVLNIAHPDSKKRQDIFPKVEHTLDTAINNSVNVIPLTEAPTFLVGITGPDLTVDPSFTGYVKIDDEIIKYTGIAGNTLTGCVRGQLGTTAASHNDESQVESFYRLEGNAIDLALKLMLSGWNDYFLEDIDVKSFNFYSSGTGYEENSLFIEDPHFIKTHNVVVGDFATITLATAGANNVTLKEIDAIEELDDGVKITFLGVAFVDEPVTAAQIKFRSQYDTLPTGLGMYPDEVDINQHLKVQRFFLSSLDYDFYLKDAMKAKEFIEQEIYYPAAAYSIPRKAQASVGYTIGPIPAADIKILNSTNIVNGTKAKIRRSTERNFYNAVVIKFEELPLEDKFIKVRGAVSGPSIDRIKVGVKTLTITSKGLRVVTDGVNFAIASANRRLNRYRYGAEFIENLEITFRSAYNVEIGDLVILKNDMSLPDTKTGTRGRGEAKFYEVINKTFDLRRGKPKLTLVNTGYSSDSRYGLISHSSNVSLGISQTEFKVARTGNHPTYRTDEGAKWSKYEGIKVRVRSRDNVWTRNGVSEIESVSGNTIKLVTALGFTPQAGDVMTLANYDDMTAELKLLFAFMNNTAFDDGGIQYQML